MQYATAIWQWLCAHELVVWLAATLIVNLLLRAKTPEQWVEWCDRYPRAASVIRLLRAIGVDPAKLVESGAAIVRGKARVDWFTALPDSPVIRSVAEQMLAPPKPAPDRDTDPAAPPARES